jgi:hypothetical protein
MLSQIHNRELLLDQKNYLKEIITEYLELPLKEEEIDCAVKDFLHLEAAIDGRVAGNIEDYIFNYFVRKSAAIKFASECHSQLEIGVLFGGSFIYTFLGVEDLNVRFIALDPLDGYYVKDEKVGAKVDTYSNKEVCRDVLARNIDKLVKQKSKINIIQKYSTDSLAIEEVKKEKLSVLFIDGDHSYSGVKFDFENYAPLIVDGGYVIIDNYNDISWREVKLYCDEILSTGRTLGCGDPLVIGRSLIMKKGGSINQKEKAMFSSEYDFISRELNLWSKFREAKNKLEEKSEVYRRDRDRALVYKDKYLLMKSNPMKYFFNKLFRS